MRRVEAAAAAAALGLLASLLGAPAAGAVGAAGFGTDLALALATARAEARPVFVHFTAAWCEPCQRMKRDLYTRPDVRQRLAGFVTVEVDTDGEAGKQAWMDYRLPGLPVVVFLRPDGEEALDHRLTGVPDVAGLLGAMDAVLALPAPERPTPAPEPSTPPPLEDDTGGLYLLLGLAGALVLAGVTVAWRRRPRP